MTNAAIATLTLLSAYGFLIFMALWAFRRIRRSFNEDGNYIFRFVMSLVWLSLFVLFLMSIIMSITSLPEQFSDLFNELESIDVPEQVTNTQNE